MRMNAYFPMSTANPTGRRPWNFAMQGGLGLVRVTRRPMMGRLGRLGDSILPAGSILSYTAVTPASFGTPANVVNAVSSQLSAQWGITILSEWDGGGFFTTTWFTLQVQTTRDYGAAGDVKSILDSVIGAAVGAPGMIGAGYSSTIAITQAVSAPLSTGSFSAGTSAAASSIPTIDPTTGLTVLGTSAAQAVDPMTWITQNFTTVAIFIGALVLLPPLIKKL